MKPYSNYTNKELSGILSKHTMLSLIAKKELKQEFIERDIEVDATVMDILDKSIEEEHQKISHFEYLKNLGFKIEQNDSQTLILKRSFMGYLIDILAIVVGLTMAVVGLFGLGNLMTMFGEQLNIFSLITGIARIVIGVYGLQMIYNGAIRLLEYYSFSFVVHDQTFYVKKPLGAHARSIEGNISGLYIKHFEKHQSLMYEDYDIIRVNAPGIFNAKTLQDILKRSQESISTKV